jgi:hypothetical protein
MILAGKETRVSILPDDGKMVNNNKVVSYDQRVFLRFLTE